MPALYTSGMMTEPNFAIALVDTYGFTPQMSALGLQLNWFVESNQPPASMNQLHLSYWLFDGLKIAATGLLLWLYNRKLHPVTMMG